MKNNFWLGPPLSEILPDSILNVNVNTLGVTRTSPIRLLPTSVFAADESSLHFCQLAKFQVVYWWTGISSWWCVTKAWKTFFLNWTFVSKKLAELWYSPFDRAFVPLLQSFRIEIWQGTRVENLTELSHHLNNLLMNFTELSCRSRWNTQKLCHIFYTQALPNFNTKVLLTFFRKPWKFSVTNWYTALSVKIPWGFASGTQMEPVPVENSWQAGRKFWCVFYNLSLIKRLKYKILRRKL